MNVRLNLGAGEWRPAGYVSVDLDAGADVQHDLSVRPWPFADESADEVLAAHILEHFDKAAGVIFLRECLRILAPGGLLRLAVPDMDKFIACRLAGDWSPLYGYRWRDFNHFLGGDDREPNPHQRHRHMYSFESLAYTLEGVGFSKYWWRQPGPLDNPAYHAISLYLDAVR